MGTFDPNIFLEQAVDAPLETQQELCPEGEYVARIDDFDASAIRTFESEKDGAVVTYTMFRVPFVIDDEEVKKQMERDKVVVTAEFFLDVDDAGRILTGKNKNTRLGNLAETAGVNGPGFSIGRLRGAGPMKVRVAHRPFNRKEPDGQKVAQVIRWAPMND